LKNRLLQQALTAYGPILYAYVNIQIYSNRLQLMIKQPQRHLNTKDVNKRATSLMRIEGFIQARFRRRMSGDAI
jgi:hypothetical protein